MQQWVEDNFEQHLALLETLAAIPAPSHHEERRARFIYDWLVENGAKDAYIDGALNVILPFGCEGRDDITVYMAHTDVVFPDMTELPVIRRLGWQTIRDRTMYTMLYGLCCTVLMQLGRFLVSLVFGASAAQALGFFTTDVISLLFTLVIIWIVRRLDGMLEDQNHYLLRVQKEQEEEKGGV